MKNWMKALARKYKETKAQYPNRKLMIVFDIDGTILDMRHMLLHVLKSFDETHATRFFDDLSVRDIMVHENQVARLLVELNLPFENHEKIIDWYNAYRWSSEAVLKSHHPFSGVMEVIRWFQMQPNTYVGLNTGRPEILRLDTLRSLNRLGKEYKVQFTSGLLFMNPFGWKEHVKDVKAAGIEHFRKAGFQIFAMIDNEPENLDAISKIDANKEILLLHADTIFKSQRKRLPACSVSGSAYDITDLIFERCLPQHVQFVWHGVNDEISLNKFLRSPIQWAECDVRMDPATQKIVLRHDDFKETPMQEDEELVYLDDVLDFLNTMNRSIKLDLKENGPLLDTLCKMLEYCGVDNSRLWFNAKIDTLGENGLKLLKTRFPSAILQCPIDHLIPDILHNSNAVEHTLQGLVDWGINRFSVKWNQKDLQLLLEYMDRLGFELNIYQVPDLPSFLKTVLLMPRSITADFNFSEHHSFKSESGKKYQHNKPAITKIHLTA